MFYRLGYHAIIVVSGVMKLLGDESLLEGS